MKNINAITALCYLLIACHAMAEDKNVTHSNNQKDEAPVKQRERTEDNAPKPVSRTEVLKFLLLDEAGKLTKDDENVLEAYSVDENWSNMFFNSELGGTEAVKNDLENFKKIIGGEGGEKAGAAKLDKLSTLPIEKREAYLKALGLPDGAKSLIKNVLEARAALQEENKKKAKAFLDELNSKAKPLFTKDGKSDPQLGNHIYIDSKGRVILLDTVFLKTVEDISDGTRGVDLPEKLVATLIESNKDGSFGIHDIAPAITAGAFGKYLEGSNGAQGIFGANGKIRTVGATDNGKTVGRVSFGGGKIGFKFASTYRVFYRSRSKNSRNGYNHRGGCKLLYDFRRIRTTGSRFIAIHSAHGEWCSDG